MASNRYQIVVQGEASETDSDDEVYLTSIPPSQMAVAGAKVPGEAWETDSEDEAEKARKPGVSLASKMAVAGAKVPGEAWETDSEDEAEKARRPVVAGSAEYPQVLRRDLPPLIVIRNAPDFVSVVDEKPERPEKAERSGRYNTLLQQKLTEGNARLRSDVTQTVRQVYSNATRDIRVATTHLNNSQNGIINASHSIRLILEDLKSVSEKIDIITSCNLLPDITIDTP